MSVELESNTNLEEIYTWIEQIPFSKPKKNVARDFSDGVFMAELLKRYYPKLVDIHNYIPGNSIAKKIDNWCTLNRKVLSKLDIKLGKDVINQLANSQAGVIEKVLTDVRTKILKDCNADRNSLYFEYEENENKEVVKSILNPEEIANKTVPRHVFVRLKQELEEKNEVINTLYQKVSHLESLMKLKDQRITDLTSQIIKPIEQNISPRSIHFTPTSNILSKFRTKI
ncbi:PREDICTED: sperm flagellar protein 1-like [Eufriesea mexicana]|uniref:sperm flagellar protein 1-like n=1 Tax=Eufriesea mexicana TaxID=516756 RepID=UPI00083BBB5B|nr:PREDICTED: sperm flagellar protein 1-like [Eufriesea mexicana]